MNTLMGKSAFVRTVVLGLCIAGLGLQACGATFPYVRPKAESAQQPVDETPAWFDVELTDARTGESFTMNDFAGRVVLVETMAMWCPTCLFQAHQVREMHKLLDSPDDVVSVSLDVDLHEDTSSLKQYVQEFGFEWRFAVAPLDVDRALGNLYSAQYLNPPLSPMLIIDRDGGVHQLEYGDKKAEDLYTSVLPYLGP
jgi:cytochrome oxidase Cu insertion factor (SCO1/SenC/PrrC family)